MENYAATTARLSAIFAACWEELPNYADRDAYVSDLALSIVWQADPYAVAEGDIPAARLQWLGLLWDTHTGGIRPLLTATGLSQSGLARRFDIPLRTVQCWCGKGSAYRPITPWAHRALVELLLPTPFDAL